MDVVTFGEAIFRTATRAGERLEDTHNLNFYLGGTELNLAANLQALGISTKWVSALPQGLTGELILNQVRKLGIDTSSCVTANSSQVAWYMMESGAPPRPDIVFHRNSSALGYESAFSFDWKKILSGARVFHSSGVTCGLSKTLTSEIKNVIKIARNSKVLVSYDLNYRKNIWSLEEFVARQKDFVTEIDILFCSRSDLKLFFGDNFEESNFANVFSKSKAQVLVMSQRSDDNRQYGIEVVSREGRFTSEQHQIQSIDRIGVGDSMAAGFFKKYLENADLQQAANWGALCGALKYGIVGDMALLKTSEVQRILDTPHTGIYR